MIISIYIHVISRQLKKGGQERKKLMKKPTLITLIVILGLLGNHFYRKHHSARMPISKAAQENNIPGNATDATHESTRFKCDGRIYCSQMTSCEEAKFFLENCPGVKMDGDNDGVPCEQQWCK
jgi:hypothetical protein